MNTELGGTDQFPLDFNVAVAPYPKTKQEMRVAIHLLQLTLCLLLQTQSIKRSIHIYSLVHNGRTTCTRENVPSWNGVSDDELGSIIDGILAGTATPEKVDRDSLVNVLKTLNHLKSFHL